jgi:NarL family two-component system response regulator LiaR
MRSFLRMIIEERRGMAVAGETSHGNEAIVEAGRLQPDVILLDLVMPRKSGLEALQEIVRVAPHAKVIVFSGFSIASVAADVLTLGAVLYLQKGASPEAIIDAIEQAATQPAPLTPLSANRQTAHD